MIPDDDPVIGERQIRQHLYRIILCKYGIVLSDVKITNQNHFDSCALPVAMMSDQTSAKILTPWNFKNHECAVYRFNNPMYAAKRSEWHKVSYTNASNVRKTDVPVWNEVTQYEDNTGIYVGSFDSSQYMYYAPQSAKVEYSEDGDILESKESYHMHIELKLFLRDLYSLLRKVVSDDINSMEDHEETKNDGKPDILKYTFRLPFVHCVFCAILTGDDFTLRILHFSLFPSRTDYINRSRSMNRYLGFAGRVDSLNPSGESMISIASAAYEEHGSK
jgi:hypothetical protein